MPVARRLPPARSASSTIASTTATPTFAGTPATLLPGQHIVLNPLEDRDSVQFALSLVINALATGQLEVKRATALLYGLQLASQNAQRTHSEPFAREMILSTESLDDLEVAPPRPRRQVIKTTSRPQPFSWPRTFHPQP